MSRHHLAIKNDPRWKAARLECFERDGWACVDCGETEDLQADHLVELHRAPELGLEVDNLATRCGPCNRKRYTDGVTAGHRLEWLNPKYAGAFAAGAS